jgi:sporulation protein YlmC with PRC-barrel domain
MKTALTVTSALAVVFIAGSALAQTPTAAPAPTNSASVNWASEGQWRVHKMIGLDVYNQNNAKIGDIAELLVDHTGKIQGAILGVGGFLGVDERIVSVNFDQLTFVDRPVEFIMASGGAQASTALTKSAEPATPTTGDATTARPLRSSTEKWYPDHAIINITADQLKALPKFEYN